MSASRMNVSASQEPIIMTTQCRFTATTALVLPSTRRSGTPRRARAVSRWITGLLCALLLAIAPLSAAAADERPDRGPGAVDVPALDAKVVPGAPDSLGAEVVQAGGSPNEEIEYYAYDAIGSVRMVFDAAGTVVGQATYNPFGTEIAGTSGMPAQRFTGQARDHEAGLDYFNARSYMYRAGRFSTPDPLSGKIGSPQSWNRYAYSLNNGLSFTDPSGLQAAAGPPCSWVSPFEVNGSHPSDCVFTGGTDGGYSGDWSMGGGSSYWIPPSVGCPFCGSPFARTNPEEGGYYWGSGGTVAGNGGVVTPPVTGGPTAPPPPPPVPPTPPTTCTPETRITEVAVDFTFISFSVSGALGIWEQSRSDWKLHWPRGGLVFTPSFGTSGVDVHNPKLFGRGGSVNYSYAKVDPDTFFKGTGIVGTLGIPGVGGAGLVTSNGKVVGASASYGPGSSARLSTRTGAGSPTRLIDWGTCAQ